MGGGDAYSIARRKKRFELAFAELGRTWSFAKEPSTEPGVKRLAIALAKPGSADPSSAPEEWDRGTWTFVEKDGFATPEESLAAGKLHVLLAGEKLSGEYVFVETKKG